MVLQSPVKQWRIEPLDEPVQDLEFKGVQGYGLGVLVFGYRTSFRLECKAFERSSFKEPL